MRSSAGLLLCLLLACDDNPIEAELMQDELDAIRMANERYVNVNAAVAEGFQELPGRTCVGSAESGAAGVHFMHPDRLGLVSSSLGLAGTDAVLEWRTPEALLYEPHRNNTWALVGVAYIVFESAWKAAGNAAPPTFFGVPFQYVRDDPATPPDEARGFAPHYELRVWLYRDNPGGMFAMFNPDVRCS